jgi:hypothetical protein
VYHQSREVGAAQHEHAAQRTQQRRGDDRHPQADQRVGHHVLGEERGHVSPEAEEGRMAQRDDAGEAEDQVERHREQRQDGDLVEQQRMVAGEEQRGEGHDAERYLPPAPGRGGLQRSLHGAHLVDLVPNRPCGRKVRITIINV